MPDWNEQVSLSLVEKIDLLSAQEAIKNIFPLNDELSNEIDVSAFGLSLLKQPDLFLRLRPGKKEKVLKQLQIAFIDFDWCSDDCVRLPNQTKLHEIIKLDKDAVVQDCNSQRVLDVLKNSKLKTLNSKLSVWDCCAASGGKSILFFDCFTNLHLMVSDVRESILFNLRKRFSRAGIIKYDHFVADLTLENISINKSFDVVICDAPCSGSGTWARTPEQLAFFNKEKIDHYSNLQKNIALNAGKAIKHGGYFLYITCSVLKKENEEVVDCIRKNLPLTLVEKQYLKGYDKKADTLFVALFSQL